jgi:hypothetical protein
VTQRIRTSLERTPSAPASDDQLKLMAKAAGARGWLCVKIADLKDDFERQFATNILNRILGIKPK